MLRLTFALGLSLASLSAAARAEDWTNWRGPLQTGYSPDMDLPDSWKPDTPGKNNLVWKQPYGCRSTAVVMNDKVFIISAAGETPKPPTPAQKAFIGERIVAFDAKTGKVQWEVPFNVFHTDIVTNRLGWAPLAGDPKTNRLYAHTSAGFLVCLDGATGKVVWERQLTEGFGRVTGYGGRLGSGPFFDEGLVIVGIANASWGDQAKGANRFLAFDSATGKVVWISTAPQDIKLTYSSNPVSAVIGGEKLLISGGADGGIHAFQFRTGKRVWSFDFSDGPVNAAPVVDGDLVYCSHGEENPGGGPVGGVICLNGAKVADMKPAVVWDSRKLNEVVGYRFGLSSPAIADGKLYIPDDFAKLYCFDAKTGKYLWKYNYGKTSRGAPVIADGKIYLAETNATFHVLKLNPSGKAPQDSPVHFKNQPGADGFVECNSTPAIANGKIYFGNRDEFFCVGKPNWNGTIAKLPAEPAEADGGKAVAQLALFPADVTLLPGGKVQFEIRAFNAAGQSVPVPKAGQPEWSLPQPPIPKGAAAAPPALDGKIDVNGLLIVGFKPGQQGYVELKLGGLTARARVRVAPPIPYMQDFEKVPVGAIPGGWINTQAKFVVKELDVGGKKEKVLFKTNTSTRPPLARGRAYITLPTSSEYIMEADVMGLARHDTLPEMGVICQRYTLLLEGGKGEAALSTWDALTPPPGGRVVASVPFPVKSGEWYHFKLEIDIQGEKGVARGKIWPRSDKEPEKWTVEVADPRPNKEGAAGLYAYMPNSEATVANPGCETYFKNVKITPKKGKEVTRGEK